nr:MAG TPA: glycoside hydrolase family protein [Caudoviricetes sp.]
MPHFVLSPVQADEIHAFQNLPAIKLTSKKGLGGIIPNQYISDFTSLGISSATINVCITQFMHLTPRAGDIAHTYGGRTYYMDEGYLKTVLDVPLLEAAKRNIAVAAIILVEPAAKCVDPDLGVLLQHPDYERGVYTMPNMTTLESVNCYAAAFDFLAKRYCTADNRYGRIAHWIMHNEVDGCIDWTNMGVKPLTVFTDTYIKSMRICYNIVRQYDKQAEVLGSFTHSWTQIANVGWWLYTSKEIIDLLNVYSRVEGDFQWGLAYHSYSQDLTNPCVWIDPNATFSMDTQFITFKNLEVLSKWALTKENKYKGTIKRSVWLSEAGVNSPTYSDEDFQKQAASLAFAWKKINALEGIDGLQWHNWFDHPGDGACFGLRKYLDESYRGEAKPVWEVYRKAGTNEEDEYFEQFLPLIGIPDWNIIENF